MVSELMSVFDNEDVLTLSLTDWQYNLSPDMGDDEGGDDADRDESPLEDGVDDSSDSLFVRTKGATGFDLARDST